MRVYAQIGDGRAKVHDGGKDTRRAAIRSETMEDKIFATRTLPTGAVRHHRIGGIWAMKQSERGNRPAIRLDNVTDTRSHVRLEKGILRLALRPLRHIATLAHDEAGGVAEAEDDGEIGRG